MSFESPQWIKPDTWVEPTSAERELVIDLLGKVPQGEFCIAARDAHAQPTVIENAPFFNDGTPMPTRYWLIDKQLVADVSRVESMGGVKLAQEEIDFDTIAKIHDHYEQQRDFLISPTYDGPRPTGGVGGTRRGLKCLHTHVANLLGSGDDAVGQWTLNKIDELKSHISPDTGSTFPVTGSTSPVIQSEAKDLP